MEIWKDIEGFGSYQVSNMGRVKSLGNEKSRREKILKPGFHKNGYLSVILFKDGKRNTFKIHRLVAIAFIPNPNNLPQVNHKNEDKTDNRVENLEWASAKENANWGTRNARMAKSLSIPVAQYDKNGNFIKEWESATQVERELGICQGNIVYCCKGKRKSAGGFIWKYAESDYGVSHLE